MQGKHTQSLFITAIVSALFIFPLFGNFFSYVFLSFFPTATKVLGLKELAFAAMLLLSIPTLYKNRSQLWFFALPVFILLFWMIGSTANKMQLVGSFRQMAMPMVLFLIGFGISSPQLLGDRLPKLIQRSSLAVLLVGVLFYVLPPWNFIDIKPFILAKKLGHTPNWIPSMFLEPIKGGIPRLVSTFLDPINVGHAMVFGFGLSTTQTSNRIPFQLVYLVGIVLTICKGAWLQLGLFIGNRIKFIPSWLKVAGWIALIPLVGYAAKHHDGIKIHLHGLTEAFHRLTFLGYGIGKVGNQAQIFGGYLFPKIGDSLIGALIGQVGLLGTLIWLTPFGILVKRLGIGNFAIQLLIYQLIASALSENAFNVLSIYFLMLYLGGAYRTSLIEESE